jgi:hypothetical protein
MESVWIFLPLLMPVVLANLSERHRLAPYRARGSLVNAILDLGLRYLPFTVLTAINVMLLAVAGLALLSQAIEVFLPQQVAPQAMAVNWLGVAAACAFTSALAFLPLIPAVRRWLARWLPIDPNSVVHTTALAMAVYQLGLSLGLMAVIGDLENLTNPDLALSEWDVLLGAVPLVLIALAGVGLFVRRGSLGTLERLGLQLPTWKQLAGALVVLVLLLLFGGGVNFVWQKIDPAGYELVDRVTNELFGDLLSVGGALTLGLSAGISEELLFRGAVQPRLGLVLATLLFTVGHLQYGLTIATFEVFVIGLVLGLVRRRANTTVSILIHAAYNASIVFLGLV